MNREDRSSVTKESLVDNLEKRFRETEAWLKSPTLNEGHSEDANTTFSRSSLFIMEANTKKATLNSAFNKIDLAASNILHVSPQEIITPELEAKKVLLEDELDKFIARLNESAAQKKADLAAKDNPN
jgi:hypothetical protein